MHVKYKYRENYFKNITPRAAYILGWIWSDGCIIDSENEYQLKIGLKITESNKKVLTFIANELCEGGKKLYEYERSDMILLIICNKVIVKDIESIGCMPRKSLIIKPPKLKMNSQIFSKFLLGCMEGDGCVDYLKGKSGSRTLRISIAGTKDMCNWWKDGITNWCSVKGGCITKVNHSTNLYILVYKSHQAEIMLDYMYDKTCCYHNEKRKKAYDCLNQRNFGLLTCKDIARISGMSSQALYTYTRAGLLPYTKIDGKNLFKHVDVLNCANYVFTSEIARMLGVTRHSAQRILKRYNFPYFGHGRYKGYDKVAIESFANIYKNKFKAL